MKRQKDKKTKGWQIWAKRRRREARRVKCTWRAAMTLVLETPISSKVREIQNYTKKLYT